MAGSLGGRPSREGPLGERTHGPAGLSFPHRKTQRPNAEATPALGSLSGSPGAKSSSFMGRKFQPPPGLPRGGVQVLPVLILANQETGGNLQLSPCELPSFTAQSNLIPKH